MSREIKAVQSPSAAIRLRVARDFVTGFLSAEEVLLIGASRGAVDDLARSIAIEKGATFGLHRMSFTQLAARLAAADLAARGRAPSSSLGHEAVAARAAFEAVHDAALEYFAACLERSGVFKALARTLLELRLAGVLSASLATLRRSGADLAELFDRVDTLMDEAGTSDRASLFATATKALAHDISPLPSLPVLLLDVPFDSEAESDFCGPCLRAHRARSSPSLPVTRALAHTWRHVGLVIESLEANGSSDLTRLSHHVFSSASPPERESDGRADVVLGAGRRPRVGRVARRMLKEAGEGVRFDEMAILLRSPQQYVGVLEHALGRAGIPAYFDRGIRRPHPAGRAFLAILSCGVENLSAKRFAEYLSLGQVPQIRQEPSKNRPERFSCPAGRGVRRSFRDSARR